MEMVAFWIVAAVAVVSAVGVITRRNAVQSAISLLVNLFSVAVLYLLLRAEFLAAVQVVVYAGAIMVLFLFVIMMLIPGREEMGSDRLGFLRSMAVVLAVVLVIEAGIILGRGLGGGGGEGAAPARAEIAGAGDVGLLLFSDFLLPLEATAVLLLVAVVGTMVLARTRREK
jgi:NADH-quinone oxidoreductase subunit J